MNLFYFYLNFFILFTLQFFISAINATETKIREKRNPLILYGPFSVLNLIVGFGTPIADLVIPSVSLGYFMRAVYLLPKNASDYYNAEIAEITRNLPISRWDIYEFLEKDSEIRGYGGRQCVLRAICEAAFFPLDQSHGLFEEIFHTIFTPTSLMPTEPILNHSDNEYFAAHNLGKYSKKICKVSYPNCKFTFLDLFTRLYKNFDYG